MGIVVAMERLLQLSVLLCACLAVWALPEGAPEDACDDLIPQHFVPPQTSPAPFALNVQRRGNRALVTLERTGDLEIRGFIIQARDTSGQITGRFGIIDAVESKILSCPGGDDADNTVTHTDNNVKNSIQVEYIPPAGSDGSGITFSASVVAGLLEFWVGLESAY